MSEQAGALNCMHDQQAIIETPSYIVRRLTPLECSRLQGLPDCEGNGWADIPVQHTVTDADIQYWKPIWDEWAEINGTKPKTAKQIAKWLTHPISESAQYEMYGNGIATPQWFYVCDGIAEQHQGKTPTMASLFDGTGSFPWIWETIFGKGTAVWSSEVKPDAIRVSQYRINEWEAHGNGDQVDQAVNGFV